MNFNATLYGQMIAFAFFVWFCAKYIWPVIIGKLEERQAKIADGLAAGEKGQRDLKLAEEQISKILQESRDKSRDIIEQARKHHDEIVDKAKDDAHEEGQRILTQAKTEIERERQQIREELRSEVSSLALVAAEQILMREVDRKAHSEVLDEISTRL